MKFLDMCIGFTMMYIIYNDEEQDNWQYITF